MRVVVDIDIPFIKGVLEPYAEVLYLSGAAIDAQTVRDADALIIRTRTKCNSRLLSCSKVRFVATATIGVDHIDREFLSNNGIALASAPGCNAGGVMQYVFTALYSVAQRRGIPLKGKTIGVVGAGNTGERVARLAEFLGFNVLRNDPPREKREGGEIFSTLDYLLKNSDIVSLHLPLDETTKGLASAEFFSKMKKEGFFINTSRGEVVDDSPLLARRGTPIVLDVWNGEPSNLSSELLSIADIATPHIAGYSFEGKVNGTAMVVQAFAKHFGISELANFEPPHDETPFIDFSSLSSENQIAERLLELFPIFELDAELRRAPESFEKLRTNYKYRHEFRWK